GGQWPVGVGSPTRPLAPPGGDAACRPFGGDPGGGHRWCRCRRRHRRVTRCCSACGPGCRPPAFAEGREPGPRTPGGARPAGRGPGDGRVNESLTTTLRRRVAEDLAADTVADLSGDDRREFARERAFLHLDALSVERDGRHATPQTPIEEEELAQAALDAPFGLGRLQNLVDDNRIENIDINGCARVWATFADGSKRLMDPVADSDEELVDLLRSAAQRFGLAERRFDMARPELDLQLPGRARLSAVMAVAARPSVSIRRHRFTDLSLGELCTMGAVDDELCSLLSAAVRARKNIVVSGAMNSGKTTLLRALAAEVDPRERIVTIEQAFELGLDSAGHRHPD